MGIWNIHLRRNQVRKMGKIRLDAGFSSFLSLYQPNNSLENISLIYFPPLPVGIKKLLLGTKNFEGATLAPPPPKSCQ